MFRVESQDCHRFQDLTVVQYGREIGMTQLGPSVAVSNARLYQSAHIGYIKFRYGTAYDQKLRAIPGFICFGLLDSDNPPTWRYDHLAQNDALTVMPHDDYVRGVTPVGFRGAGIIIDEGFLTSIAKQVYDRPLKDLLPAPHIFCPLNTVKLCALRAELNKWEQLVAYGADARPAIIARREESLALAIFDGLARANFAENNSLIKSKRAVVRAMEIIHSSDLENISAAELCRYAECSQRALEMNFSKQFGVTPKKYIKYLRLAQVHSELLVSDGRGRNSIIEVAGANGFWHMGQFAADYRRIYGELPSETLKRN